MDVQKLLGQPESKTLEFKRDLSSLKPILKTVVAFANTAGGVLIVGCTSDGKLKGLGDVLKAEEKLASAIADNIRPVMLPDIEIATVDGHHLLVVQVAHWRGPFYMKQEGVPNGVYVRLGSTSRPAGPELATEMRRSLLNVSYDQEPLFDLTADALDMDLAKRFFSHEGKKIDRNKLRSLGVLVSNANRLVPSIGGLILFGKEEERKRFVPDARVSCARFLGSERTEIIDKQDIEGTILEAIEGVSKFVQRNTRTGESIEGMRRKGIPEYPPKALREALINALAHANYALSGSRIQIAIFTDRLEIQNPGMLPFGFTLEDLKSGISKARNRVIVRTMHELSFMEEWGHGYQRIIEACHVGGYPEPTWTELSSAMRVTFYPHRETQLPKERIQPQAEPALTERQSKILSLIREAGGLSIGEILDRIRPAVSRRTISYDLTAMRERGLIKVVGRGRSAYWAINP